MDTAAEAAFSAPALWLMSELFVTFVRYRRSDTHTAFRRNRYENRE